MHINTQHTHSERTMFAQKQKHIQFFTLMHTACLSANVLPGGESESRGPMQDERCRRKETKDGSKRTGEGEKSEHVHGVKVCKKFVIKHRWSSFFVNKICELQKKNTNKNVTLHSKPSVMNEKCIVIKLYSIVTSCLTNNDTLVNMNKHRYSLIYYELID